MATPDNPSTGTHSPVPSNEDVVAIVLAGAGARGAYEAGFIATLLPHLQPRPKMMVGTSAGAINAALLASVAHLPPDAARDEILGRWRKIKKDTVLGPIGLSVLTAVVQYASALLWGGDGPSGLLDTRPLFESLKKKELVDWGQIEQNLLRGDLHTLALVATEGGSGRTKVFYQSAADAKSAGTNGNGAGNGASHRGPARVASGVQSDLNQAIDYIRTCLGAEHVRASAAIPVLFPPVALSHGGSESMFVDGGVRLNAPLKPALALGAKALVVISTDPRRFGTSAAAKGKLKFPMQDQVLEALRAIFADRMIEDIRVLEDRNRLALAQGGGGNGHAAPPGLAYVPLIFGGPQDPDRVGSVAARATRQILRGPRLRNLLDHPVLSLLEWFTSISAASGPDLVSYVLFEPEFIAAALDAGIQDAEGLLNDYPDLHSLWGALRTRRERKDVAATRMQLRPGDDAHPS